MNQVEANPVRPHEDRPDQVWSIQYEVKTVKDGVPVEYEDNTGKQNTQV